VPLLVTEHVAAGSVFVPFNQPGLAANTLLSGRSTASVSVSVEAAGDGSPSAASAPDAAFATGAPT
jgi:hypothetical protein